MVAVRANNVDQFIGSPPSGVRLFLFYGPNQGLSSLRADDLVDRLSKDQSGSIVKLYGNAIAADPSVLLNETNSTSLFERTILIRIRIEDRSITPVLKMLDDDPPQMPIVALAGDLKPSAPLRKYCEGSKIAAALPSYALNDNDRAHAISKIARQMNLSLEPGVASLIGDATLGDMLQSNAELEKLALFATPSRTITAEHASSLLPLDEDEELEEIIDLAFDGQPKAAASALERKSPKSEDALAGFIHLTRHIALLSAARAEIDSGTPQTIVINGLRAIHFKRKNRVSRQIEKWPSTALQSVGLNLREYEKMGRLNPALASELFRRSVLSISSARR